MSNEDAFPLNEKEVMEYYGLHGRIGQLRLRMKILNSWILHTLAYSSPYSEFTVKMQRARGVNIGKHCHFSPYVQIDLIYPKLVTIGNNVTLGSNIMIFAHTNPTANLFLKNGIYPRIVRPVNIKNGAVITSGSIVLAGITIGENSIVSPGSIVTQDVPDYCVVVGNPARVVKKIDH